MSTYTLIIMFILFLLTSSITLDKLEQIATKIENNLSKRIYNTNNQTNIDNFKYIIFIQDFFPFCTYDSRALSNAAGEDIITYKQFHISYSYKMIIEESSINKYHTSITRELASYQTFDKLILIREPDNSFRFTYEELNPRFIFGKSDLLYYRIGFLLSKNLSKIGDMLHYTFINYLQNVLIQYPTSYSIYYFKQFINNLILFNKLYYGDSRNNYITFLNIRYLYVKKIDNLTSSFVWVFFDINTHLTGVWKKEFFSINSIEFSQMSISEVKADLGSFSQEISYIINKAFKEEFEKFHYYEKYQDPSEIIEEV